MIDFYSCSSDFIVSWGQICANLHITILKVKSNKVSYIFSNDHSDVNIFLFKSYFFLNVRIPFSYIMESRHLNLTTHVNMSLLYSVSMIAPHS